MLPETLTLCDQNMIFFSYPILDPNGRIFKIYLQTVKSMLSSFTPKNISFGTKAVPPATPQEGGRGGEVG